MSSTVSSPITIADRHSVRVAVLNLLDKHKRNATLDEIYKHTAFTKHHLKRVIKAMAKDKQLVVDENGNYQHGVAV